MLAISVAELSLRLKQGLALRLLDVRRAQALAASGVQIAGAQWLDPALWLDWKDGIAAWQAPGQAVTPVPGQRSDQS